MLRIYPRDQTRYRPKSCKTSDPQLTVMKFFIDNLPVRPLISVCKTNLIVNTLRSFFHTTESILVQSPCLLGNFALNKLPEQYAYMCDLKRTLDATVGS